MILKVVSSNLTIRRKEIKHMNYKDKKYLSESKWLTENLSKLNFFFIGQLKSCDSYERIELQKELRCMGLKVRLISFRNCKKLAFFSGLSPETKLSLLKGKIVVLYNEDAEKVHFSDLSKVSRNFRPLFLYSWGRFLEGVSKADMKFDKDESWSNVLTELSGLSLTKTLNFCNNEMCSVFEQQGLLLVEILSYKVSNENKF